MLRTGHVQYTVPYTTTPPLASSRPTCGLSRDLTWACVRSPVRCRTKGDVIVQLHLELYFPTTSPRSLRAQLPQIIQPQHRSPTSTSKEETIDSHQRNRPCQTHSTPQAQPNPISATRTQRQATQRRKSPSKKPKPQQSQAIHQRRTPSLVFCSSLPPKSY